ncbi:MAG: DUF2339 domain-containing protein, partial [Bradymonadaceae bacterium]
MGSLAAIGGFATPFLLSQGSSGMGILAMYTALVSLGMFAIYLLRGWRSLLFTTSLGAWAVLFVAQSELPATPDLFDQVLILAAIALVTMVMIFAPALGTRFQRRPFGAYEALHTVFSAVAAGVVVHGVLEPHPLILVAFTTVLGLMTYALSHVSWQESGEASKALAVAGYGLGAFAVAAIFDINVYAQALLVIGVAANILAREDSGRIRLIGLIAMGILGLWCAWLLIGSVEGSPIFNPEGLQLVFATIGLLIIGRTFETRSIRWFYYWASLIAALAVIAHQPQDMEHGVVLSTCAWGFAALIMLIFGMFKDHRSMQLMGLVTIVATAGKLLLFDLHDVDAIWRMALFMGFGVAMLVLSAILSKRQSAPGGRGDA